ncbi:MAG: A24 family peptidase [Pseudomonadota bacterium]
MMEAFLLGAACFAAVFLCHPVSRRVGTLLVARSDAAWRRSSLSWLDARGPAGIRPSVEHHAAPPAPTPDDPAADWSIRLGFAALAGFVGSTAMDPVAAGMGALTAMLFAAAALADLEARILPDLLVAGAGLVMIALAVTGHGPAPRDALIAFAAGGAAFWTLARGYAAIRGRDGLGLGDVKLFAVAGLGVGWVYLPHVALGAVLIALLSMLAAKALRREIAPVIAFGPAIAASILLVQGSLRALDLL